MIRSARAAVAAVVLVSASACDVIGRDQVEGSGDIVSETRDVSGFTSLEFRTEGEITLVQGLEEGVTIETDANLMQYLDTTVEGGTLIIETNDPDIDLDPSDTIEWTISVIGLASITLPGAGRLYAVSLNGDTLDLAVPGAMDVAIGGLTVRDLAIDFSGAGNVDLLGNTTTLTVDLSGAGNIDVGGLAAEDATVRLSGAGNVTLWATETLDATVSGAGNVEYRGDPEVQSEVTGTGAIRPAG